MTGVDLTQDISADLAGELRAIWLENKVIVFPNQNLSDDDLERFTLAFGEFGEDPFFGHIDGHENIAAIQRDADEKTPIFAEFFHSDWSFLGAAGWHLSVSPFISTGNTLFADQVAAYERLPDAMRDKAENLTAVHSAELGYAPYGAYGDDDKDSGRSMNIIPSERACEARASFCPHAS